MLEKIRNFLITLLVGKKTVIMNAKLINVGVTINNHTLMIGCSLETGKWSKGKNIPDSKTGTTLRPIKGR